MDFVSAKHARGRKRSCCKMFQSKPISNSHRKQSTSIATPNGHAAAKYEMSPFIAKPDSAELGFDNQSLEMAKDDEKSAEIEESQINNTFIEVNGDFCYMHQNPNKALKLASKGEVEDLERLFRTDPERLKFKDAKGHTPLHHASAAGHVAIIDFLISTAKDFVDINDVDNCGSTALHLAVENDRTVVIEYLIRHGANTSLLDGRNRTPLHLAVELNKHELLDVMLKFDSVDPNLGDDKGSTPLHYAAWKDHAECALKLLDAGAKLCVECLNGLHPLHVAAQNASSRVLQVILDHAEKSGCKREELLSHISQERFTPLHAAISSGDIKALKVLLDAGAEIEAEQEDGSNAIHLAAAQGATEMIQLMCEMRPEKRGLCLTKTTAQNMTPLHKAVLFDREPAMVLLLQQGADINAMCEGGLTPLLLAASKKSWKCLTSLFRMGARCDVKDNSNRNILHLIIKNGGKPSDFNFNVSVDVKIQKKMLNQKDKYGCTPLHYASRDGYLATTDDLIKMGAILNAKNNKQQSPLHFAARYGRYNTCCRLLDGSTGKVLINETDERFMTPIHLAALNGHVKVVQLLLQRGAGIYRDIDGNTPLHLAAKNGYTTTMNILINVNSQLIDMENKINDTPLHVAARGGQASAVSLLLTLGAKITVNAEQAHFLDLAIMTHNKYVCTSIVSHERWREVLDSCSSFYGCPLLGMIKHMPDICEMILDRCRVPSCCDQKDKSFHCTYDFRYLQTPMDRVRIIKERGEDYTPMLALNTMVKFNRVECLSHPVCMQYLKMKWSAYGMAFHVVNLLIYLLFLASLTAFVSSYAKMMDILSANRLNQYPTVVNDTTYTIFGNYTNGSLNNITERVPEVEMKYTAKIKLSKGQNFLVYFILVFCALNVIKEIMQIYQQKWKYFSSASNYMEWILYITTGAFIGPFIIGVTSTTQWSFGTVSTFLAWFNLLLYLQRFDFFGIYVVMFLEILKTLLHVIIVFSVLIIAFGLSFYVLLCDGTASFGYRTPPLSLLTTVIMMLGNIDYIDNWVEPVFTVRDDRYVELKAVMLILFVLLMPILLINLLIGLAVGDIEAVQRDARLKRLAMQVKVYTDIEKKLPQRILEKVDKTTWTVYPNCRRSRLQMVWHALTRSSADSSNRQKPDSTELENQTYIYQELYKQKQKINDIAGELAKNYSLLRLIVQKMEIHTEADEMDEGGLTPTLNPSSGHKHGPIGWSSPAIRQNLLKQAAVIHKWRSVGVDLEMVN